MTNRFLSALRSRVAALRARPAPSSAPAAPATGAGAPCEVLQHLSVTQIPGAEPKATLGALFRSPPHRSAWPAERLGREIRTRAAAIDQLQPGYQPVYGFLDEFPGKRRDHLERNVTIVHETLEGVGPKHQVRILDVGCNSGYVTLRLAESFPNVVGLEISQQNLQLCRLLAAHAESPARFYEDDVLAIVDSAEEDLENVDVVLLYNVVHQFIFHHGFAKTQALLARLASRVDTVIVELALKADYVRHGKDHLLPENPEDVLAACADVEITRLHDRPRPVYRLRRRVVRVGPVEIRPERIEYSPNPDPLVSRKYYTGEGKFLKLYRFADARQRQMADREVAALEKLQHTNVVPRLLGHVVTPCSGAVLMSQVVGERLVPRLYNPGRYKLTLDDRMRLTRQYVEIAKLVHDAVGYQNDLQAHNLLVQRDGSLVLVDFEQAGAEPVNDPFGLLLWSLFDFWGGRAKNRPEAIRSLHASRHTQPATDGEDYVYPDFSALTLPPVVASLALAAAERGDWGRFLDEWLPRLKAAADTAAAH